MKRSAPGPRGTPHRRAAPPTRSAVVARVRARLLRNGYPRLQMLLLVALTSGVGFIASSLLLRAGLDSMGLRYATAVVLAYLFFLALLWLWLRTRARDYLDAGDPSPPLDGWSRGDSVARAPDYGSGGESAGGGASSSFEVPGDAPLDTSGAAEDAGGVLAEAGDALGGADEAAIPLALLAIVAVVALSSLWLVYSAPVLFAELTLDALLGAALYRRLRRDESRHWIETALRRTAWPFVLTLATIATIGFVAQGYVPDARSIGDVLIALRA